MSKWRSISLLVAVMISGLSLQAQSRGWTERYYADGCSDISQGDAYRNARQRLVAYDNHFRNRCDLDSGDYTVTYRNGMCGPYNPNRMFCRVECPVFAKGTCSIRPLTESWLTEEKEGNMNRFIEPGETHTVNLTLTNQIDRSILGVVGTLAVTGGADLIDLTAASLSWGDLYPGQSAISQIPGEIAVHGDAPCGARFALKANIEGSEGQKSVENAFTIGRFAGQTKSWQESNLPLSTTRSFNIDDVDGEIGIHSLQVSLSARANNLGRSAFYLTAPDGTQHQLQLTGGQFSSDLAEVFADSKAAGQWVLTANLWGRFNRGTLQQFSFNLVTREFICE